MAKSQADVKALDAIDGPETPAPEAFINPKTTSGRKRPPSGPMPDSIIDAEAPDVRPVQKKAPNPTWKFRVQSLNRDEDKELIYRAADVKAHDKGDAIVQYCRLYGLNPDRHRFGTECLQIAERRQAAVDRKRNQLTRRGLTDAEVDKQMEFMAI